MVHVPLFVGDCGQQHIMIYTVNKNLNIILVSGKQGGE